MTKSRGMTITMYTPAPENAGGFFRCFFLARGLTLKGHDVTVVCGSSGCTLGVRTRDVNGVTVVTLPRQDSMAGIFLAECMRIAGNVYREITRDPDILHVFVATVPSSAVFAFLAKFLRFLGAKRHAVVVDWEDWWGGEGIWGDYSRFYNVVGTFLEERVPRMADMVTVVSDALFNRARSLGIESDRITRVTNGSDSESVELYSKQEARNAVCPGIECSYLFCHVGLTYVDAFRVVLESLRAVKVDRPDVRLMLIGELPGCYLELVRAAGLEDCVLYFGKQPYDRMGLYLRAADVLLLSMRDSIIERARWPIRMGDYLAAGRPIIATAMGEVARIIEDWRCGIGVPPYDVEAFARAMTVLMEDSGTMEQMGLRAREAAEGEYAWSNVAGQLEAAYCKSIARGKAARNGDGAVPRDAGRGNRE